MREVRDFPWATLNSWRRADALKIRSLVRHLGPSPHTDLLGPRWTSLLGDDLDATPSAPFVLTRAAAIQSHEGLSLAAVMHHPSAGVVVGLCDRRSAIRLAARGLGADDESARRAAADNVYTQAHEGALAALSSRALALAVAPSAPPSLRTVTDHVGDALDALGSEDLVAWPWRVSLGHDALWMTFVADLRALVLPPPTEAVSLRRVTGLDVRVSLIAARSAMGLRALAALRVGDALVLESLVWRGESLAGTATLALGPIELDASIVGARELKISSAMTAKRELMTEPEESTDVTAVRTEALGSLPVEVAVEIAQTTVSVAEIGRWRVGEVVAFNTRIGERVTVRASGRAVARGELVDVDGEVGVRITEIV